MPALQGSNYFSKDCYQCHLLWELLDTVGFEVEAYLDFITFLLYFSRLFLLFKDANLVNTFKG